MAFSELGTRVLSALVLIPLALAAAYLGGWAWSVFWLVAAIGVLWEWLTLATPSRVRLLAPLGAVGYTIAAVCLVIGWFGAAAIVLILTLLSMLATVSAESRPWVAGGFAYATVLLAAPVLLRGDPNYGGLAVVFLFAIVWMSDIAGYFAGKAIGGPKLWARVSPKKTVSGAVGGTLGAIAVAIIVAQMGGLRSLLPLVVLAFGLSVASQAGDLLESAIKRRFGAKDASQLIPGHGGLMDRLDGFITASAVAATIGIARGGIDFPAQGLLVW